jgi:PAS domain S-box-containing protein
MTSLGINSTAKFRSQLGKLLLVALVYFASGKLGLSFATQYNHITLFWLPSGIAVAALLRWGMPCCLTGIFLGGLLAGLSLDNSFPLAVGIAIGNTLAPLATVRLLKRWKFDHSFSRQRDLLSLIAASSLGMLLSASIGVSLLLLANQLSETDAPSAWLNWWLGDSVGVLLAGPLLLSISRTSINELLRRPAELFLASLLLGATGVLVFFVNYGDGALPLAFLPLPLVLWAALRIGVTGTSLAVLALSLLTTIGTALGKGVFGTLPGVVGMYVAWLYMFTLVLCGLMVITMLGARKNTESSLMHANELLALAQLKAKAGIWDWDLSSGKLTWTNEMYILFGLDPDTCEASFKTWRNLIHPDDRKSTKDKTTEAVRNGVPLFNEFRIVLPDGETKWINAIGKTSLNKSNQATRMTGLCIDVTEHKQAEERLRFSEELLRQTQSVAAVGSWRLNFQNNELVWSAETYNIFGIKDSAPKNYDQFLELVYPDDRTIVQTAWQAALKGAPFIVQHRIVANGEIRWVEEQAKLDLDAHNNLLSATGSVQDITARINTDEQLISSLRLLEEKELAKTRFLAAAGHDLRQPITAATLYVDTLKLTSPTPRQSEIIRRLDQSMSTFAGLLDRLLDISKFDAGLIKPQINTYNLAKLFIWLDQNFAQTARSKNLRFRLSMPLRKQMIVRTDMGLLQSIMMNLVSNAIKFTTQGGILVGARLRGDKVLLQVWDTGIGISDANIPRIFDEFYQVANPQRSREVGLGLGLSISQRAMSLLGGEVTCRSRPGSGSVFELLLPLNGEPSEIDPLSIRSTPGKITGEIFLRGKQVVVVEDDSLVAGGMINLLQSMGAEVRHFHNAEEALQFPYIAKADFFIADYSLGGKLSGLQFLETIQLQHKMPIHAVVVTGETSSQFIHSISDCPWPVLHKPINYSKLAAFLFSDSGNKPELVK